MPTFVQGLTSSLGRKYLTAISGLLWCGFVLSHMLGNLLIFVGPEAYNKYSHSLTSNPLIYLAEGALVVFLLMHIVNGITLTLKNRGFAVSGKYAVAAKNKTAEAGSRWMKFTGLGILAFLIPHLALFKFGPGFKADENYTFVLSNGEKVRDIFKLVIEHFHNPAFVATYVIAMFVVGFHLIHGFASSFQSLGFNHPKYTPTIKRLGALYAGFVAAGFAAQPLYVFFIHK